MPNAVALRATEPSVKEVVFRFNARRAPDARSVALVGSFNRWDTSVHRLTRGTDQWWSISLSLPQGKYSYLLLVDGVPWNDPEDNGRASCDWGGQCSVRVVA